MKKILFIFFFTFLFFQNIFSSSYLIIKGKPSSFKDFSKKIKKVNKIPCNCRYKVIKNNVYRFPNVNSFSFYLPDPLEKDQKWLSLINGIGLDNISTGKGILIGVLDSGVELDHEDLKGQIIDWYNSADNNTDVEDWLGHGTAVVGIMGAIAHNGNGIIGVSPDAKYVVVKITHKWDDTFDDYSVAKAIYYLVDKGCRIINMSIQMSKKSEVVEDAINYAKKNGVILVSAAGNRQDSPEMYPASNPYVLGVSAVDENNNIAQFSSYDNNTFIFTIGENILTTYIGNTYLPQSGTSFSAPIVSGIIADILSLNKYLTLDDIKKIILASTNKFVNGTDFKILDAKNSLISTGIQFYSNKYEYHEGDNISIMAKFPPMSKKFNLYIGLQTPDSSIYLLTYKNHKLSWILYTSKLIPVAKYVSLNNFVNITLFGENGYFPSIQITNQIKKGIYSLCGIYEKNGEWLGYFHPIEIKIK